MNKLIKYPIKKAGDTLDKIAMGLSGVAGAVGLSQLPAYISHYTQRLGGAAGEALRSVEGWQNIANKTTSGSLEKLINTYEGSSVQAVIEAGKKCAEDICRGDYLQNAYNSLTSSSVWTKPIEFIKGFDYEIALGTLKDFSPNLLLTPEGAAYAGVGFLLGAGLYYGGKKLLPPIIKKGWTASKWTAGCVAASGKGVVKGVKNLRDDYRARHNSP
jgi:hypothetical protein